jgi:DNA-binding GntR family transcriptional regulator
MMLHDELETLIDQDKFQQYIAKDELVHSRIEAAASNPVLLRMLQVVSARVRRVRYAVRPTRERQKAALDEHGRIMTALRERDCDALSRAIKVHLDNSFRFFEASLLASPDVNGALAN